MTIIILLKTFHSNFPGISAVARLGWGGVKGPLGRGHLHFAKLTFFCVKNFHFQGNWTVHIMIMMKNMILTRHNLDDNFFFGSSGGGGADAQWGWGHGPTYPLRYGPARNHYAIKPTWILIYVHNFNEFKPHFLRIFHRSERSLKSYKIEQWLIPIQIRAPSPSPTIGTTAASSPNRTYSPRLQSKFHSNAAFQISNDGFLKPQTTGLKPGSYVAPYWSSFPQVGGSLSVTFPSLKSPFRRCEKEENFNSPHFFFVVVHSRRKKTALNSFCDFYNCFLLSWTILFYSIAEWDLCMCCQLF